MSLIAYLVTAPGSDQAEGTVAQGLYRASSAPSCQGSAIRSLVYEICAEPKSSQLAKDRLFRHYASIFGVKLRHIRAKYQQPEICSFDSGECKLTNAELYIAHLDEPGQHPWRNMARDEYTTLVSSIYNNVYLMSYALAEPQLTEKYRDFLEDVMQHLFAGIKGKTIELH